VKIRIVEALATLGIVSMALLALTSLSNLNSGHLLAYPAPEQQTGETGSYPGNAYPGPSTTDTSTSPYPGPESQAAPTPMPTQAEIEALHVDAKLVIPESKAALSEYSLISHNESDLKGLEVTPAKLTYSGPLPSVAPSPPTKSAAGSANLVDNWELLFHEGFEGVFPQSGCVVSDANDDGLERYWGPDSGRPLKGNKAAWPAKGGANGMNPGQSYPSGLDSWLVCGPFNLSQADKFIVQYSYWLDIFQGDYFFYGVSTNGTNFDGLLRTGNTGGWVTQREHIFGVGNQITIWLAWAFESQVGGNKEGMWLDELQVWQYDTPTAVCGNVDPGSKGIVLPPYDPTANGEVPIIRAGDTIAVDKLKAAGVHWVRLGFIRHGATSMDWQGYDRMVDTLCANGISVVGLINHETLWRQDYNNPGSAEAYRQTFAAQAGFMADYYKGRIRYWEIWNEQNLPADLQGAFIDPIRYAPLLREAFIAIVNANYQARILFGGLASAWGDSNDYFTSVYESLNNEWGSSRPFDYFAVHPYARVDEGPNPQIYMYADQIFGYHTIIDKFMETMADNNDGNKRVWVTEVGWNSSKGSPTRPVCLDPVLVYETEQAAYLKPMFDILFNEVSLWNNPGVKATEKVVWYQYMDVGTPDPCASTQTGDRHAYVSFNNMSSTSSGVDWWFGLYRGDKVTPKEAWCSYRAYPQTCAEFFSEKIYLPIIIKQ
jgi:hypothetical protein